MLLTQKCIITSQNENEIFEKHNTAQQKQNCGHCRYSSIFSLRHIPTACALPCMVPVHEIHICCVHISGFRLWYRHVTKFWPKAQCVVHALEGLACRAHHSGKLACLTLQADSELSTHATFAPRARLRQPFSRMLRSQKT